VIIADTHVWLWWVADRSKLSRAATRALSKADRIGVSPISAWEISMLVLRGRLRLDTEVRAWVLAALAADRIEVAPFTADVAVTAANLSALHPDPADRIIVATALENRAPLVTRDVGIAESKAVKCVW